MTIRSIAQTLSPELLTEVQHYISSVPWRYGWASNKSIEFTHWNHDIAAVPGYNSVDCVDRLPAPIAAAWASIQAQYLGPQQLMRCYTNSHTYGVEGYPHTDSRREQDYTLVMYLTADWQRKWGGETIVYSGDDIVHAELPRLNKSLVFPGNQVHQARSVTRVCPAQRITLMFKFCAPGTDPHRDQIQKFLHLLGTHKTKHSGRSLTAHLLNTYDILKQSGADQATCSAGAMHSIHGTNQFKTVTVAADDTATIGSVIGSEAAELAVLFGSIARPGTLESALKNHTTTLDLTSGGTVQVDPVVLSKLCKIEAANLLDQRSLHKYTQLSTCIVLPKES